MERILTCVVFLVTWVSVTIANESFILFAPSNVRKGMTYKVDLTLTNRVEGAATVNMSMTTGESTTAPLAWPGSTHIFNFAQGENQKSHTFQVPNTESPYVGSAYIHVKSTGYKIGRVEPQKVTVKKPDCTIIIQTDKGIYNPGNLVLYRILKTDAMLKPTKTEEVTLEIEDANKNIVIREVDKEKALIEGSFQVSDNPLFGEWTIKVSCLSGEANVTFNVTEYVRPKFEVMVQPDRSYIVHDTRANKDLTNQFEFHAKLKGVYTYGKSVRGKARFSVNNVETDYSSEFRGMKDIPIKLNRNDFKGDMATIKLFGSVEEEYTGNEANDTQIVTVYFKSFKTVLGKIRPYSTNDQTYTVEATLTRPSGDPYDFGGDMSSFNLHWTGKTTTGQNVTSVVAVQGYTNTIIISQKHSEGEVDFSKEIEVWYEHTEVGDGYRARFTPVKYDSNSGDSIKIHMEDLNEKNERCFEVSPYATGDKVYYQVIDHLTVEDLMMYTGNKICIPVTRAYAPKSTVVAYSIHYYGDEETVMSELLVSSEAFYTPFVPENEVTVELVPKIQRPGGEIEILVNALDEGWLAISALDKSVTLLDEGNPVTMTRIINKVSKSGWDYGQENNADSGDEPSPMAFWRGGQIWNVKSTTPKEMVDKAGLVLVTDFALKQNYYGDNEYDDYEDYADAMLVDGAEESARGGVAANNEGSSTEADTEAPKEQEKVRTEFPETWLWELVSLESSKEIRLRRKVPDIITNFIVNVFSVGNTRGLGVAKPVELTVFQPFFISMNLPHSIVRGETFTLEMLVFNYMSSDIRVEVTLTEQLGEFTVADKSKLTQTVDIVAGGSNVVEVPIKSIMVGNITLFATAVQVNNATNKDMVQRDLLSKPEGYQMIDSIEMKATVPDQNGMIPFNMSAFFKNRGYYVEDSLSMYLRVTGDMMGPLIDNLEAKIQKPYGCGEQNIKSLTPSLAVGPYLEAINKLDQQTRDKLKRYCEQGYTKELTFFHNDSSVSAFGQNSGMCGCGSSEGTRGSTWLTAYVLKTFSILGVTEYTYVDIDLMYRSFQYLLSVKANTADEYVREFGTLIHKEMAGGSDGGPGLAALYGHAIVQLKTFARHVKNSTIEMEVDAELNELTDWLRAKKQTLIDAENPYQLSVTAFLFGSVASSTDDTNFKDAEELLNKFKEAINNTKPTMVCPGYMYGGVRCEGYIQSSCKEHTDCEDEMMCCSQMCGGMTCMTPVTGRPTKGATKIEAYGYALLGYLSLAKQWEGKDKNNDKYRDIKTEATNLLNWLLSQRKAGGLFQSTQDMAVGFAALSGYATTYVESTSTDFTVTAMRNNLPVSAPITLTDLTASTLAEVKLTGVTSPVTDIKLKVEGTAGMAYATIVAYHNNQRNSTETPIIVTVKPLVTKRNETLVRACFKHNEKYTEELGTMVVIEMNLQSGQTVTRVEDVQNSESGNSILKFETNQDKTQSTTYFMDSEGGFAKDHCADIYYDQTIQVENIQRGVVTVMDYYEEEHDVRVMYEVPQDKDCSDCPTIGAAGLQLNMFLLMATCLAVWIAHKM